MPLVLQSLFGNACKALWRTIFLEKHASHFGRENQASESPLFAILRRKVFFDVRVRVRERCFSMLGLGLGLGLGKGVFRCKVMLVKETAAFWMHVAFANAFNTLCKIHASHCLWSCVKSEKHVFPLFDKNLPNYAIVM